MFAHKRTESGGGFVGYKRAEGGHKRAESISSAFGHKRSESGHKRNESSGGFGHKRWFLKATTPGEKKKKKKGRRSYGSS